VPDNDPGVLARVKFLHEMAAYFEGLPAAEDRAHWANVYNAKNCRDIATYLESLSAPVEDEEKVYRETLAEVVRPTMPKTASRILDPAWEDVDFVFIWQAFAAMREYARRLRAPVQESVTDEAVVAWLNEKGCVPVAIERLEALEKSASSESVRAPVGVTVGEPALTGLEVEGATDATT
jgi:hypothetical protein